MEKTKKATQDRETARKEKFKRPVKELKLDELLGKNDLIQAADGKRGTAAAGEYIASQRKEATANETAGGAKSAQKPAKRPAAQKKTGPGPQSTREKECGCTSRHPHPAEKNRAEEKRRPQERRQAENHSSGRA